MAQLGEDELLKDLQVDTNFERAEKAFKDVIFKIDTLARPSKVRSYLYIASAFLLL